MEARVSDRISDPGGRGSNPKRSVLTGTLDEADSWTVVSPNGVKDRAQPWA